MNLAAMPDADRGDRIVVLQPGCFDIKERNVIQKVLKDSPAIFDGQVLYEVVNVVSRERFDATLAFLDDWRPDPGRQFVRALNDILPCANVTGMELFKSRGPNLWAM